MAALYDSTDLYENGSFTYEGYPLRTATGAGVGSSSATGTVTKLRTATSSGAGTQTASAVVVKLRTATAAGVGTSNNSIAQARPAPTEILGWRTTASSNPVAWDGATIHSLSTSYNGITFIPDGDHMTGLVSVFGFNQ